MIPAVDFREFDAPSPNFAEQPAHEGLGVCFHHTVLPFAATLDLMSRPESRVSYHVVIDRDGGRARLVDERHVAWHAGLSAFQGRQHCNAFLLGVAFAGDTHTEPLADAQIASALEWLDPRWAARCWTPEWMTDHRQIAPGRKNDLAPAEWTRLLTAIRVRFLERG